VWIWYSLGSFSINFPRFGILYQEKPGNPDLNNSGKNRIKKIILNCFREIFSNTDPQVTSYNMLKMWTDFAKTGNPTPTPDSVGKLWERLIQKLIIIIERTSIFDPLCQLPPPPPMQEQYK
jgi:hypothetical protein